MVLEEFQDDLVKFLYCESKLLQQRNYQLSKELVHELKLGDIAVMQIQTFRSRAQWSR